MNKSQEIISLMETVEELALGIREKINKDLINLVGYKDKVKYFKEVPIKQIINIFKKYNIAVVQEDHKEWKKFQLGKNSSINTKFILAPLLAPISSKNEKGVYIPYQKCVLMLNWFKVASGEFEINCYIKAQR